MNQLERILESWGLDAAVNNILQKVKLDGDNSALWREVAYVGESRLVRGVMRELGENDRIELTTFWFIYNKPTARSTIKEWIVDVSLNLLMDDVGGTHEDVMGAYTTFAVGTMSPELLVLPANLTFLESQRDSIIELFNEHASWLQCLMLALYHPEFRESLLPKLWMGDLSDELTTVAMKVISNYCLHDHVDTEATKDFISKIGDERFH